MAWRTSAVVCQQVRIINKLGLHARAAAKFVTLASRFASEILVARGDRRVNGKSILGVMMLAAAQGCAIDITAIGDDEQDALRRLVELINRRFGEPE
jgi:phosphocarrier protein